MSRGRGSGRVDTDYQTALQKKNPGFIYNSRSGTWTKDPNYKGEQTENYKNNTVIGNLTDEERYAAKGWDLKKEGMGQSGKIKKKKKNSADLIYSGSSASNLTIGKKTGKRGFRTGLHIGTNSGGSNTGVGV